MLSSQYRSHQVNHRRQKSSPLAFNSETATEYFPMTCTPPNQQGVAHRRGNSFDQHMRLQDITNTNPGNGKVSFDQVPQLQQTLREAQMRGQSQPGQFNNLDDIFATTPHIETLAKGFPDFGPLGIDATVSGSIEDITSSIMNPPLQSQSNESRPRTPSHQIMKSKSLQT